MALGKRKQVLAVSDQVWLKPACTNTETSQINITKRKLDYYTLQILNSKGGDRSAQMQVMSVNNLCKQFGTKKKSMHNFQDIFKTMILLSQNRD